VGEGFFSVERPNWIKDVRSTTTKQKKKILTIFQIHSENGTGASREGDSQREHLHEQVHSDDSVPGLAQVSVDEFSAKQ
jgi:hypothetical protein